MIVCREEVDGKVCFKVSELGPVQTKAVRELGFRNAYGGFVRVFDKNTPSLDKIYGQFVLHAEEMIMQAAGLLHPDWESALELYLQRIMAKGVSSWWLTGSTALGVRGIDVLPRNIDIVVATGEGAKGLGGALSDWLFEPVQTAEGCVARWFGRAFSGVRIEWVGEVEASVDHPERSDFGPAAATQLEAIKWRGYEISVPPLRLQLAVSVRRGLSERADKILEAIA